MKRFWKDVTVASGEGYQIHLDGRPVRTPGRAPLALPNAALAEAIAGEWREVGEELDPRTMTLTGIANAVIDRVAPDPQAFAASLARYADSDLLYYRADEPDELVERQAALWDPLLDWARSRYDVHFELVSGVMPRPQPAATVTRLGEAIAARPPFELGPLSPLVTLTGTLIGALALAEGAAEPEALWAAANVDEDWQIEQWGEDALASQAREARTAEFEAATRFLKLVQG